MVPALGAAVLVAVSTALLLAPKAQPGPAPPLTECHQPLAMNILVSPDLEQTVTPLAATYQRAQHDGAGCPRYAMTVYPAPPGNVRQAFRQQWTWLPDDTTSQYFQPTRDVGPQPAIWIPGSSAEAWLVGGDPKAGGSGSGTAPVPSPPAGKGLQISVGDPLAWTRPVVAVPQALADRLPGGPSNHDAGSWRWSALLPALRQAGADLVRPNPTSTSIGLLHTMALYSALDNAGDQIRRLENSLNATIQQDNYRADDDAEMLCRYADIAQRSTHTALLVADRSLTRYLSSSGGCSSKPAPLVRLVLDGVPAMDHPFVTVSEPGHMQAPRLAAAADFERWMRSDADAQDQLRAATGGYPGDVAQADQTRKTMDTYQRQRARGRVLIALETSNSMAEPTGDNNEGSPLDASKSAIEQAMTLLGTDDEVGLLVFNARAAGRPTITTPISLGRLNDKVGGQSRRSQLIAMSGTRADAEADRSPLYEVIDRGLSDLARHRSGPDADVSALVVITYGRRLSGETFTALQSRLGSLQDTAGAVPVHVLAFHGNACKDLAAALAETVGGSCLVTTPGRIASDLRTRLAGLWKGAAT